MSSSLTKPLPLNVEAVFHMNEGLGDTSYAMNSTFQLKNMDTVKNIAAEMATQVYVSLQPHNFAMADLGCSTGTKALVMAEDIIRRIGEACGGSLLPEFSVLLNDLPTNDFNTLFLGLPDFTGRLKADGYNVFLSGIPGSFYGRLFPSRSLHFVFSSTSLHWLSQVPAGLVDELTNKPINKAKMFISSTSPPAVAAAYLRQFQTDFSAFLRSRASEMVSGGRIVLSVNARETEDQTDRKTTMFWDLLSDSFAHLVSQGLVEQQKVDSFDIPYYPPSIREIELEVRKDGSFNVEFVQLYQIDLNSGDAKEDGRALSATTRAVQESMLTYHFGPGVVAPLFEKYAEIIADAMESEEAKWIVLGVVLVRL